MKHVLLTWARFGQSYEAYIADNSVAGCPSGTYPWYGNALVTAGARRAGGPIQYQFVNNAPTGGTCVVGPNECRGMVCVPVDTFAGAYAGCSAHLNAGRSTITTNEASEYSFVLFADSRTSGIDKVAMGDFNLVPGAIPSVWPSAWNLSVYTLTHPNLPTEQIDYIWWSKPATSSSATSSWCVYNASDHCMVQSDAVK